MNGSPVPVIRAADTAVHQLHGASFISYAAPSRGSSELCAWRVEIPPCTEGVPHRISREEVLYVLTGTLRVTVDDQPEQAAPGDVVLAPAGSRLTVGNATDRPAAAWVTTTVGFADLLPDGTRITLPNGTRPADRRHPDHAAQRLLSRAPMAALNGGTCSNGSRRQVSRTFYSASVAPRDSHVPRPGSATTCPSASTTSPRLTVNRGHP